MSCTQLFAHLEISYYLKDDDLDMDRQNTCSFRTFEIFQMWIE